jgi:hypothetical protein
MKELCAWLNTKCGQACTCRDADSTEYVLQTESIALESMGKHGELLTTEVERHCTIGSGRLDTVCFQSI